MTAPTTITAPEQLRVLTAAAAWPFSAGDRARGALRAQLRQTLLNCPRPGTAARDVVEIPDWSTLTVTGPSQEADGDRTWFGYAATVSIVALRPTETPPRSHHHSARPVFPPTEDRDRPRAQWAAS